MVAGKIDLKRAKLNLIIGKKDKIKFQKMITGLQITSDYDGENTTLTVDLEKFNAPKLGGLFNREHTVQLNLKLDYSDLGENLVQKDKEFSISRTVILKVD